MHNQGGEITNILRKTFTLFDFFPYTFKILLKIISRNSVMKTANNKEHLKSE